MCILNRRIRLQRKAQQEEARRDAERKEAARRRLIEQQDGDINLDKEE